MASTAADAGADADAEAPAAVDLQLQPPPMQRASSTSSVNSPLPVFNNTVAGSVYANQKMRPLKKDDGVPLWRADIQYDFLRAVFEDKTAVFTPVPRPAAGEGGEDGEADGSLDTAAAAAAAEDNEGDGLRCFADVYIDAMCRSSKTSKILRQQMQNDRQSALATAMICLLVNIGRMNTTLCFSPDMRAHLRTYHPIPCLQAHQPQPDSDNPQKQLQDAPRLKSILKRARGDHGQPVSIEDLRSISTTPRTNPINLVFLLSQYAPKVTDLHFPPSFDFYDLVTRDSLSSSSRARAFLWLMWFYLESDLSSSAAENNPFGSGRVGEGDSTNGMPLRVPELEVSTPEEAERQDVDLPEEIEFGEKMQQERRVLLEVHEFASLNKSLHKSATDMDDAVFTSNASEAIPTVETSLHRTRSQLSPSSDSARISSHGEGLDAPEVADRDDDDVNNNNGKNAATPSGNSKPHAEKLQPPDSSRPLATNTPEDSLRLSRDGRGSNSVSPSPASMPLPPSVVSSSSLRNSNAAPAAAISSAPVQESKSATASNTGGNNRRNRPMNQQQIANVQARKQRVESLLDERRKQTMHEMGKKRRDEETRTSVFLRAKRLLDQLPEGYDTEEEEEESANTAAAGAAVNAGSTAASNGNAAPNVPSTNIAATSPRGKGGICPNPAIEDDFGEAASFYASVIRKTARRLSRWDWNAVYDRAKNPLPPDVVVSRQRAPPPADVEQPSTTTTAPVATPGAATKISAPRRNTATKRPASTAVPPSASEPPAKKVSRPQPSSSSNKKRSRPSTSKRSGSVISPTLPVPPRKGSESRRSSSNNKKKSEDQSKASSRLSAVPARLIQQPSDAGGDIVSSSDVDMTSNIDDENEEDDDMQDNPSLPQGQQQQQRPQRHTPGSPPPESGSKPTLKSISRLKVNDPSLARHVASSSQISTDGYDIDTSSVDMQGRDYSSDARHAPESENGGEEEEEEEEEDHDQNQDQGEVQDDRDVAMEAPSSLYGDG